MTSAHLKTESWNNFLSNINDKGDNNEKTKQLKRGWEYLKFRWNIIGRKVLGENFLEGGFFRGEFDRWEFSRWDFSWYPKLVMNDFTILGWPLFVGIEEKFLSSEINLP